MSDYGGITVRFATNPEIISADDVIGISIAALTMGAGEQFKTNDAGELVIVGELTYRPVRFDQDGRVIVCQRVQELT